MRQVDRKKRPAPPRNILAAAAAGLGIVVLTFVAIGAWGITAPLNSAIVAHGSFVASSRNKIIQHFEGGIVREILVKEGDIVERGQLLLRLDETAARAKLRRLELKHYNLRAREARLVAEQHGRSELRFPAQLLASEDADLQEILEGQRAEFAVRREELANEILVLRRRKAAIDEEIAGLEAQREAVSAELSLVEQELEGVETLFDKGLTSITKLLALKRSRAKLRGNVGALTAQIGRAKERIQEIRSQIIHLKSKRVEEAVEQLREVRSQRDDVGEQLRQARSVVERLEVRAPVKGIVVKLTEYTAGGVISSGQEMIELLPLDDDLVIEAEVRPQDIDLVRVGQESWVRLSALNQRVTPVVAGEVIYVSADKLTNAEQKKPYYAVRVALKPEEPDNAISRQTLPGMPAEVYIKTGERTLVEYLLRPIFDSLARSMREA
ncbi:HlyD family type I secretion periplasmic adaptor subunit [Dichotomicrobium thermohalophilum]|uniref:Membrane fusion protein (MFP) family protein n=1 Tax=Dichotomicrobium thermohalophilum TaxID=933063 RepID=A0A397PDW1_9HYPH|nr:HlyD family type I secretion periplasmic adaptor subunit [Dichotomicrobium thermohalophilum]RIA47696.1 HlyD family secretion protein [Dichotomicrobium thermohalophilum]